MAKILVVDDSKLARHSIGITLKQNYEVIEAANGKEGILMIGRNSPDLVLTDIVMPNMEGLEFIQWIKKNKPNLPVVAMSGNDVMYLKIAKQLGASYTLEKPIKEKDLLSTIKMVLQKE